MFELRQILRQKETEISRLKHERESLRKDISQLKNWNYLWQKHRWSEAMRRGCNDLEKEIKGLSDMQTKILNYLSELRKGGCRHVRGISRQLKLSPTTVCRNLAKLQEKGLVRAYLRNSNKKKFYTLPEASELLK